MSKVGRARLVEAVHALESCGHPVRGLLLSPDGSITLLTEVPADALPSNDAGSSWVDLAGETDPPRAKRA
jgi:hypothetical protein